MIKFRFEKNVAKIMTYLQCYKYLISISSDKFGIDNSTHTGEYLHQNSVAIWKEMAHRKYYAIIVNNMENNCIFYRSFEKLDYFDNKIKRCDINFNSIIPFYLLSM